MTSGMVRIVSQMCARNQRCTVPTRQSGIFDPNDDMPKALAHVRRPGALEEWGYITVRPYYAR